MSPAQSTQPSRKRNRPAVSCGHCRSRKLKCSRTSPCDSCLRTGDASSCSYERPKEQTAVQDQTNTDALTARINQLESLLLSVLSSNRTPQGFNGDISQSGSGDSSAGAATIPSVASEVTAQESGVDELISAFGTMKVDQIEGSTIYLGGSHWVSILSEIPELRNYLVDNHNTLERKAHDLRKALRDVRKTPSLLRSITPPTSREELLSDLPSRMVVEALTDRFFTVYKSSIPIIHEPTFRKELTDHWINPATTKLVWIALLFAILHLAELSYVLTDGSEPNLPPPTTGTYKSRTIQCLVASDYTYPVRCTIETLMLYVEAEWMTEQDPNVETSMVIGIAIRLAMRMGIHRDSRSYGLTPFQGEMRRRLWACLHRADILYSFQLSLPPNIRQSECDCGLPRNINSDQFGEGTGLPSPTTTDESTDVSYFIAKYRLLLVMDHVIEYAAQNLAPQDHRLRELQQSLQEAHEAIPPFLRLSSYENGCIPTALKKQQMGIDRIYQGTQCLLHQKFLRRSRFDPAAIPHRDTCISAALTVLNYQSSMFLEFDSSYPQNLKQRHMYTLISHGFFIAGMAIALDLRYGFETDLVSPSPSDIALWGFDRRDEMIMALETSTEFWRVAKDESVLAAKAYGLFSFALAGLKQSKAIIEADMRAKDELGDTQLDSLFVDSEPLGGVPAFDWELWDLDNGFYGPNNGSIV